VADEKTGAVKYVGDNRVSCDEATGYTVKDNEGNDLDPGTGFLLTGYTVEGIPESELGRWLLNQKFQPVDSVGEKAQKRIRERVAKRINGVLVDQEKAQAFLDEREDADTPLVERSKKNLLKIADEEGAEVSSTANKSEIIEAIEANRAGGLEDPTQTSANPPQPPPADGTITEQEVDYEGEDS
jgi:hypothetical protein